MLQPMQNPAENLPSPTPANFAGLLATLMAPPKKAAPAWNDDDLAEDVATLSYERALRTHSRYRAPDLDNRSLTQPARPGPIDSYELAPEEEISTRTAPPAPTPTLRKPSNSEQGFAPSSSVESSPRSNRATQPESASPPASLFERNLKNASVTIRMSKEECAQLHRRAAEAGLTVSAYLRSCTFEAETLRAMVKDTMAQLKSATSAGKQVNPVPLRRSWLQRLKRLLTPWPQSPRTARA